MPRSTKRANGVRIRLPTSARAVAIERGRRFGGKHERQRLARIEGRAECSRVEMILLGVEPALALTGKEEVPVPGVGHADFGVRGEHDERSSALEGDEPKPI